MACGWSGEGLLVTIKLPAASKCLLDSGKRLVLSANSQGRVGGLKSTGSTAQEDNSPRHWHLTFDLSYSVAEVSAHFLLNPQSPSPLHVHSL